jgi:soluble lytic murein transglycosylase-like protein
MCIVAILAASMLLGRVVDYAPAERFDHPSLRGFCHRGVQALPRAGTLDTRSAASRKRRQIASAITEGRAMGVTQIMPRTWVGLRARYGLGADPYNPHDNILVGAAYIRELNDRYSSPGFFAAYNAGPRRYWRRVDRYRRDAGVCRDARTDDRG